MTRFSLTLSFAVLALLAVPAAAQTSGAGASAGTQSPVPAVPPPVSAGLSAGQQPTNPPEIAIARPAQSAARPPLSAPLTGGSSGALGDSDQVNPSGSTGTPNR